MAISNLSTINFRQPVVPGNALPCLRAAWAANPPRPTQLLGDNSPCPTDTEVSRASTKSLHIEMTINSRRGLDA